MTALLLVSEQTGETWQAWPQRAAAAPGLITEGGRYLFELHGADEAGTAELLIDASPLEALRTSSGAAARWRWLPGFNAGTVEAELRIPGQLGRRFEVITDPARRKLTRDDFDTMVREILSDTLTLFSLGGFRKGIARGTGRHAPSITRLEFLRSRVDELESVVAAIASAPRHRLQTTELVLPYHRAARSTPTEILRSFRSGRLRQETARPRRLPNALKGFLPDRIRVRQRRSSLDLPEHRQMAACLRSWSEWLALAAEWIERDRPADADSARSQNGWPARCRQLARRISEMAVLPPFAAASDARPRLVLSAMFRRDPAYRAFYRLWQDMNLGISAIFGDFLNLPLARTFELYELWCFLRLLRAATEEFETAGTDFGNLFTSDAHGTVTVSAGAVTVPVGDGWKLCFQKRYAEFWGAEDRQGSSSRNMKPDIVLTYESESGATTTTLIVLEAKYRIDEKLNDALSSIHAYRDALVQESESGKLRRTVSAAYLLTPHVPLLKEQGYRETALPDRLFHPEYRARFRFGAVTLRPAMSIQEIGAALRQIIAEATAAGSGD